MTWPIEHQRGGAQALHDRSAGLLEADEPSRLVRILDVNGPAVVLGSNQPDKGVDGAAAGSRIEVARRRSGGGAVYLAPGQTLWIDVVVPAGDPWWDDDVGRAAWPLGEAWAAALDRIDLGPSAVWRGPMRRTEWSSRVCMAGIGAGEVLLGSRKVVGISQRRNRRAALFQSVAVLIWDPKPLLRVLGVAAEELPAAASALADVAAGVGPDRRQALEDALLAALMT